MLEGYEFFFLNLIFVSPAIPSINGLQLNFTNYEERYLISDFCPVLNVVLHNYPPIKMEQTERSETSAYKI